MGEGQRMGSGRRPSRMGRNLRVALRAERMIARRHVAVAKSQSGLVFVAACLGFMGVVMLSVGVFFWLADRYGHANAGLIVGVVNVIAAVAVIWLASRKKVGDELNALIDVRDMALEEIETDVNEMMSEVRSTAGLVRHIAKDPLGFAGQNLTKPLIAILLKSLKKDGES